MHTNWCVLIEIWVGLLVTALMEANYFSTVIVFHPFEWMFCTKKQILSFKVRKFPMVISLPLSCLVGKGFRKKENLVYTFMRFVANFVLFSSTFCCWDKRRTIFFEPKTWAEEKWMSLVIILVFLSSYERAAVLEWSTLMLWISRIDLTCQ